MYKIIQMSLKIEVEFERENLMKMSIFDRNGKFRLDFSKLLRSYSERSQKSKITNCLYFFQILRGSASKMLPKLEKQGKLAFS